MEFISDHPAMRSAAGWSRAVDRLGPAMVLRGKSSLVLAATFFPLAAYILYEAVGRPDPA